MSTNIRSLINKIGMVIAELKSARATGSKGIFYSKTCHKRPLKKKTKMFFKTDYRVMQVKSIAECSTGSILQYL